MKRTVTVATLAVILVLLVTQAVPVFAAWIGGIRNTGEIKKPIIGTSIVLETQPVWPGREIEWASKVENISDVTYGMRYGVFAMYEYDGYGMGAASINNASGQFTRTAANSEPVLEKKSKALSLEASTIVKAGGGGGGYDGIGELILYVDPDGPGPQPEQKYLPNTTVDIQPGQIHALRLKLKVYYDAWPGTIASYIDPFYTAPTTPSPTPTAETTIAVGK